MPHLLMDSESDDEPDEPGTSSNANVWNDNSSSGTPSVSSVFSYTSCIPLSSHTNIDNMVVPSYIPPNPFSKSSARLESNLKDPNQCMILVMPVSKDNTDSQACDSKDDPMEGVKKEESGEHLSQFKNPRQPSSNQRVSLRSDVKKETSKEESSNEEGKETPKEVVHAIKEKVISEERENKFLCVELTRIDDIYDLPKGPVDLKTLESLKRSSEPLKYSKSSKNPRLVSPKSKSNKPASKPLVKQSTSTLEAENPKSEKREKMLKKERLLNKSPTNTPPGTLKITSPKSVDREKSLVKSSIKTSLHSPETKSLKTAKKEKLPVKLPTESSLNPVEMKSPETPKKERSPPTTLCTSEVESPKTAKKEKLSVKSLINTSMDTSEMENLETEKKEKASSVKLPSKSLIKAPSNSSEKRTSRSGKKEKSLRFADEDEIAETPKTNEWLLQRSRRKAKYLFNPTLRIKQQRRSLFSRSSRSDDDVSGPQNDSKLIISVDKIISSSNESKDAKDEEEQILLGPMLRRRKGRKRKRIFSTIKKRKSESKENTKNENNNNFNNADSVDGNYENEVEMNADEESEDDTSLDQIESSFELEKEDPKIKENDDFAISKVTLQLELDELQENLKKKPDNKPKEMSLAEKIKFDILKELKNKSKMSVGPSKESPSTSDPVPKEVLTKSEDNEQAKVAPSKISTSQLKDKVEDSAESESETRLDLTELSAFGKIQDILLEMDEEEVSSAENAKNLSRKRKQEVVFRTFKGISGKEDKNVNQTPNLISCSNCKKVKRVLQELERLINLKTLEPSQLKCPICYKLFISIGYTRLHMEIDHFVCTRNIKCNTKVNNTYSKSKKTEYFSCNFCSKIFNSINLVQSHMQKIHSEREDEEVNSDMLNGVQIKSDYSLSFPDSVDTNALNGYEKLRKNMVARICSVCNEKYQDTDAAAADHNYANNKAGVLYRCPDCARKHTAETTNLEEEDAEMSDLQTTCPKLEESNQVCALKLEEHKPNDIAEDQKMVIESNSEDSTKLDVSEFITFKPKKPLTLKTKIEIRKQADKIEPKKIVEKKMNDAQEDSIMAVHHQFACPHCKKKYGSHKSYAEHMYFFHDVTVKDFVVDDLLQPDTQQISMKVDPQLSDSALPSRYCSECFLEFVSIEALILHRFTVHDEQSMVHICENCGKILTSVPNVNEHQCQNVKYFDCELCKKHFTNATKFKSHNDMHHFEKDQPNVCSSCDKLFLTNRMLRKHYRMNHLSIGDGMSKESMMFHVVAISSRASATIQRQKLTSSIISTLEYERINKVVLENYENNRCKIIQKRKPDKSKYCILCDQFITAPTLMNHWILDHDDIGEICSLCGGLYQKFKEVMHLLRHHVDPSTKNTLISVDTPFTRDVDTLIRKLGIRRLLSIILYSMIEKQFLHSEQKKCICCDRTFPEEKSCMVHFATCHDKMCILCNHVFESSKRASEHKKSSHYSLDSYLWFMQRAITHITDSLSIDPGLPLEEMISRIFVRCHEVSVSEGDGYKKRIERLRDVLSLQTMGRLLVNMIDEDDDSDQVILVVTELDYQQYKNNLEELAIRMKQISNTLPFGDIKFSLEEYFKSKEQY